MQRIGLFVVALSAMIAPAARAQVVTKAIEYRQGSTVLEGTLIYDAARTGKRPGVLLAHEGGAGCAAARTKAGQLAQLGYVVLSIDLYGKGVMPKDVADAVSRLKLTGKDRTLVRERAAAGR